MMKINSVIRIAILLVLGTFGFIFLFGEEKDENMLEFFLHFLIDKSSGIILLYAAYRLVAKWRKKDKWIKAYYKWCERL